MKGKITSLVLAGGAFAVGVLTQDGSPSLMIGSRVLTAFITVGWFGVMGTGLYFWAKHTRQDMPGSGSSPAQAHENLALQNLAAALGHNKAMPVAESVPKGAEAVKQEDTQKVSS